MLAMQSARNLNHDSDEHLKKEFKALLKFSVPYMLSRVPLVAMRLADSAILAHLSSDAVAAGPLITGVQFSIVGTSRGILLAVGIEGGRLNGAQHYEEIGRLTSDGWILSALLSIPSVAILLSASTALRAAGVPEPVCEQLGDFFTTYAWGVPAVLFFNTDQQFAVAIKRTKINLVAGMSHGVLSIGSSLALAFGAGMGIKGLGLGVALSAWVNTIALRVYLHRREDFDKYHLKLFIQSLDRDLGKRLWKLFKVGFPLGMYRILEWGNITVISVLLGLLGKEYLSASQPSIQILCATNTLLQALAQATGVYISNLVGANASMKRVRHSGISGILNSVLLCLPITLLCFSIPRPLIMAFTHVDSHDDDFFEMAQTIFYINAAGLLTGETFRQAGAGALRGQKDINFAPIWSFIMMSVLGLTSGALLSNYFEEGVDWLFITRDIGLILAGIMLMTRWALKTRLENFDDVEVQDEISTLLPASVNDSDGFVPQNDHVNYGSVVVAGVFANGMSQGSSSGQNRFVTQAMGHQ